MKSELPGKDFQGFLTFRIKSLQWLSVPDVNTVNFIKEKPVASAILPIFWWDNRGFLSLL